MSTQRRMSRRRLATVQKIKRRTLAPLLAAFGLLTQLGVVQPAYSRDGVVSHDAATVQAEREHVGTVAQHVASLLLFAAGGRIISGEGPYEHLRPLYTLPDGVTYNSWTGLTEGDVVDTADQESRAWWIANAATVVTVSASGGDYTLAQLQTALNDAATANDIRVVVVDSGAVIAQTIALPVKSGTPNWTLICCSDWWDGTWSPSGDRTVNLDTEVAHLAEIQSPTVSSQAVVADGAGRNNYALIGVLLRRCMSNTAAQTFAPYTIRNDSASTLADLPTNHLLAWSWVDGVFQDGATFYETRRGMIADGLGMAVRHSVLSGFCGTGSDTQAIWTNTGGGKLSVSNTLLEASSENFMSGGGTPNASWLPSDCVFRRTFFVTRQEWNSRHAGFIATAFAKVVKNSCEVKHGRRMLFEASVFEGSWSDAQSGPGLLLKTTNQNNTTRTVASSDIVVRLCRVRSCARPLGISQWEFGNTTPPLNTANTYPLARVDVCGNVMESASAAEVGPVARNAFAMSRGSGSSAIHPDGLPQGPLKIRWSTFVTLDAGGYSRVVEFDPQMIFDSGSGVESCVIDWSASGGIHTLSNYGVANGAQLLDAAGFGMASTFIAEGGAGGTLRRTHFSSLFPDQSDAVWWDETSDSPRVIPTNFFADRAAGNYAIHPSRSVKGQAPGGNDPGAPIALVASATSGVRVAPSFITIEWSAA